MAVMTAPVSVLVNAWGGNCGATGGAGFGGMSLASMWVVTVPFAAVDGAGVGSVVAVVVLGAGAAAVVVLVEPLVAGVLDVLVLVELLEFAGELAVVVAALLVALVALALALGVYFGTPGTPGFSSEHELMAATLISSAIPAVMTRREVMGSGSLIDIDAILAKTWTLVG